MDLRGAVLLPVSLGVVLPLYAHPYLHRYSGAVFLAPYIHAHLRIIERACCECFVLGDGFVPPPSLH